MMSQKDRFESFHQFDKGISKIMISTDILKRGIDIPKVDLVINYDFPTNEVDFQHRAARAGRFGRKGITISFIE